jgi:hypothetical protein
MVPLLKSGICYSPHVSSTLDIWFSPWTPTLLNFQPTPQVSSLIMEHPLAIADLINPITLNWNISILTFLFDCSTVTKILKIKPRTLSDALLWIDSASGIFTTKSEHHLFTSNRPLPVSPVSSVTWKEPWKLELNHRLKLFLWKMVWNIVPTRDRICKSICSSQLDTTCSLCSHTTNSLIHLFFSCPIAQVIWQHSFWPMDIIVLCISNLSVWLNIVLHPSTIGIPFEDTHLFQIFAMVACDNIWRSRNKAHHDGWIPNALSLSVAINKTSRIHFSAWANKIAPVLQVWTRPDPLCFKIIYDTAIRNTISAQAAVCRDSSRTIIHTFINISPPCTPLYGEASAALLAAQLCLFLRLFHVTFEGDSLTVNLAINNPTITIDWRISSIISDFSATIPSSTSWLASNINRSANFCAIMWQIGPRLDFPLTVFPLRFLTIAFHPFIPV